jgi:hypothetical protein
VFHFQGSIPIQGGWNSFSKLIANTAEQLTRRDEGLDNTPERKGILIPTPGIVNKGGERGEILKRVGTQTSLKQNMTVLCLRNPKVDPGLRILEYTEHGGPRIQDTNQKGELIMKQKELGNISHQSIPRGAQELCDGAVTGSHVVPRIHRTIPSFEGLHSASPAPTWDFSFWINWIEGGEGIRGHRGS